MGRPKRIADPVLSKRLHAYMQDRALTGTDMAAMLQVDKATISRAIADAAFSSALRFQITLLIDPVASEAPHKLLHKSLHLLSISDRLRQDAEAMISKALDLSRQKE